MGSFEGKFQGISKLPLCLALWLGSGINLYASDSHFVIKLHTGAALSGQIKLDQAHPTSSVPLYGTAEYHQKLGLQLMGFDQSWGVGVIGQYSPISYQAGSVVRSGSHQSFGLRGSWLVQKDSWYLDSSLDLIPMTSVTVFSNVQSVVNGDHIKHTSQTIFSGSGFRLRQGFNYRLNLNFLGFDHLIVAGAGLGYLMENLTKREDLGIRANYDARSREITQTSSSCSCSRSQLELTLHLGYQI